MRVQGPVFEFDHTVGASDGRWFDRPCGVAVDANGNVYVADTYSNQIQKLDAGGTLIVAWGAMGNGDGQFDWPSHIAVDAAANVYVSDSRNHRVQKFGPEGAFIGKWGSEGAGQGQFQDPGGIVLEPGGNVCVVDRDNNRVQAFTGSGTYLAAFQGLEGNLRLVGAGLSPDGRMLHISGEPADVRAFRVTWE